MKNINNTSTSIKQWSKDDQPYEKIKNFGPTQLSNSELLAILIKNGNKNNSAIDLAKAIMLRCNNCLNELGKLSMIDFQKINGIGETKSITIMAALEMGRRRLNAESVLKHTIKGSQEVAQYLNEKFKDLTYEVFAVIFLNQANKIIHFEVISKGGITGTVADPRIILRMALGFGAVSIILCHNHPSGNLNPSNADKAITKKIGDAASLMDIKLLDHIIVSDEGYFSFMEEGLL
jgi:DNA repair protein RadC